MPTSNLRVLWFTNTPSMAANMLNVKSIGGGWINSLEERIKENPAITLGVAFKHGEEELKKLNSSDTVYYAIPTKTTRIKSLVARHFNKFDDEQLVEYCKEVIQDFKPDIINIFGTEEGFGLVINKIRVPIVIHLQGILTIYETKWFSSSISKLDLVKNSSIKTLLQATSLFHNYTSFRTASFREQQIFKGGRYFMGRTDWDRRITSVLSPESKYFNSEEILRKEFYAVAWNKNSGSTKTFISTIQANIYKGLETVLEASALLKKVNKFEFKWLIVGIPEDNVLVKIFEKKAKKKFADYNIIFPGKLGVTELIEKELMADIFIHPSHIDNSPNSVCEAMLLGMPVIATYSGGTGSLMLDKQEGILIQDGDPYSMSGAILELALDPKYAKMLGVNARQRALKRNDPLAIANNVINIYSEILSKN
jgi:glycosyltransferase involved in cell wall biosynthesis